MTDGKAFHEPGTEDRATKAALPSGPRPGDRDTAFFDDPMVDHLLRAVVTLAMEVSVNRERVRTLEAQLVKSGALDSEAIDRHEPGNEDAADRARQRGKLIEQILGPMVSRFSKSG